MRCLRAISCQHRQSRSPGAAAFTLIELLLSMAILASLMLVVTNVIGIVQRTWSRTSSKVSEFREARMALELITRNLAQATLNTYWQSIDNSGGATKTFQTLSDRSGAAAKGYVRQSELQFTCGPTATLLSGGSADKYPGHGVFFQATLGITNLISGGGAVNTENMVNLLCGRGYFLNWGDDSAFRPPFLNAKTDIVRPRFRYRLMEYSPTAETNQIYLDTTTTDLSKRRPITDRFNLWFQEAAGATAQAQTGEKASTRAFVRPIAENIICMVISPQGDSKTALYGGGAGGKSDPTWIAPGYGFDSTVIDNSQSDTAYQSDTRTSTTLSQVTQHQLPPLIKVTLIAVDGPSGEKLAESSSLRGEISTALNGLFTKAQGYNNAASSYKKDLGTLEAKLIEKHLNYRIYTTTVIMKQAQWSS